MADCGRLATAAQAVVDFDPSKWETEAESGFVFQGLLGILRDVLIDTADEAATDNVEAEMGEGNG
jgi:hypothetical protein